MTSARVSDKLISVVQFCKFGTPKLLIDQVRLSKLFNKSTILESSLTEVVKELSSVTEVVGFLSSVVEVV